MGLRDSLPANHPYKSSDPSFGGTQVINFPDIGDQVVSTGNIELGAFSNSGLPITFTSSDTTVFAVHGKKGIIKKAGSVTVTAAQTGDNHYSAAANKTRSFTISKEDQTITFTAPPDMNIYDPDLTLIASTSSVCRSHSPLCPARASIKAGTTDVVKLDGTAGMWSSVRPTGQCGLQCRYPS